MTLKLQFAYFLASLALVFHHFTRKLKLLAISGSEDV